MIIPTTKFGTWIYMYYSLCTCTLYGAAPNCKPTVVYLDPTHFFFSMLQPHSLKVNKSYCELYVAGPIICFEDIVSLGG